MAALKYRIRGLVRFELNGKILVCFKELDTRVVHNWADSDIESWLTPFQISNNKNVFMGEGEVHLTATVAKTFVTSGTNLAIEINVNNTSKKTIPGLKVEFVKRLFMIRPESDDEELKVVTKIVSVSDFKEREHKYEPDEHRCITVHVPIPVTFD